MSRYLARLVKLESAFKAPPPSPAAERTQMGLGDIIAKAKADATFLENATPLQRIAFHHARVAKFKVQLATASEPTDWSPMQVLRKVQRVWLPSFLEDAQADIREAELDLVREAGFANLDQPGAREHLESELFAL